MSGREAAVAAVLAESEADVWDELWDTDAANCCSCPSCNYYAPDYEVHKDEPCLLRTLIERIIAHRLAAVRDALDTPAAKPFDVRAECIAIGRDAGEGL